jgi:truncated hemoglobin YjbI
MISYPLQPREANMEDWTEFYGDEEVPEADDHHERLTEDRDAWLTEAEEAAAKAGSPTPLLSALMASVFG